jgi:hypothetical protein
MRSLRFAYADPPYPGKAGYYAEQAGVDHQALVGRLVADFEDGWALSTSAEALQRVLTLCPAGVRVCAWQRAVRPTRSRRPISAWEPLIVHGGRELPLDEPQAVRDALAYGGRYRTFPGAMTGMKPPQFAVWMFAQLGARPGDQLEDLFPGSGAIGEAWRRYARRRRTPRRGRRGTSCARHVACGRRWRSRWGERDRGGAVMAEDVRGFYARLGVEIPDWATVEAALSCFADPDAHKNQDRSKSCSVNLASGVWHCHGCGAAGCAYDVALAVGRTPRAAMDLLIEHGLAERRVARPPRRSYTGRLAARPPRADAERPAREAVHTLAVSEGDMDGWRADLERMRWPLWVMRSEHRALWRRETLLGLGLGFDRGGVIFPIRDGDGRLEGVCATRRRTRTRRRCSLRLAARWGFSPTPVPIGALTCCWWRGRRTCSRRAVRDGARSRSRAMTRGSQGGRGCSRAGG